MPVAEHPTDVTLAAFALGKLDAAAADAVSRHLDACDTCRATLEHAPKDTFVDLLRGAAGSAASTTGTRFQKNAPTSPPTPALSPAELPPELRSHPRFRVLRRLGEGGMGVVYLAEHAKMERRVVIKVIHRAMLDHPDAVERFNREVRAAAKLDHPNIVKAYDAEEAGGLHLLAMEYVEGKNLSDVLEKKGQLPIANACHYVRQVALGLQHAHEKGMVHRDIKPLNVMLTPKGQVKILDFGLAKLASERQRPGAGLTQDGVAMGTPAYIAPEQALDCAKADIRADIYSLGCTLFELLTGRTPFVGEKPMAVILAQINDQPPALESLRPEVPAELAALVARMLRKKPEDRPQTPKAVAEALVPFTKAAAAGPTQSRAGSAPAPAPAGSQFEFVTDGPPATPKAKPPRRWRAPAAVAAGVALTAVVVATVIWVKTAAGVVLVEVPDGAEVRVDGDVITAKPYRITVDRAERKLVVTKDGAEIHSEALSPKDNGRTITVALVPQAPGPAPAPKEDQPAAATVLAPEQSEWAGTGSAKTATARWPHAVALTVTERRGQGFKALFRVNAAKLVLEGNVVDDGKVTVKVAQVIASNGGPIDRLTGNGDIGKNWLTLRFNNPDNGNVNAYELKRLPDAGAGFRFEGRWMCYDQPSGWKGMRPVNANGTLFQGRDKHTWTRDGGLIHVSFGQWLAIDPDNPNELRGGGGNLTVRWVRQ